MAVKLGQRRDQSMPGNEITASMVNEAGDYPPVGQPRSKRFPVRQ